MSMRSRLGAFGVATIAVSTDYMKATFLLATIFIASIAAGACATDIDEAEHSQELSIYRIKIYFSDPELTQIVGERSALCTSTLNWGVRTPYVYQEAGDCMAPAPQNYPSWGNPCTCCSDANGNGSCDWEEQGSLHSCSATFDCH
jgi:hypothetical protein